MADDEDDTRVDPRYDPAFQRGFQGQVAPRRVPPTPSPSPGPAAAVSAARSAPDPAMPLRASDAAPRLGEAPARAVPVDDRGAAIDAARYETELANDPAPTRPLLRNPFVLTLLILGAALVVGGVVWVNATREIFDLGPRDAYQYWFLNMGQYAAPLAAAVGLLMLSAVLVLAAVDWQRRR